MSFLASPTDDVLAPITAEPSPTYTDLLRDLHTVSTTGTNAIRMLVAHRNEASGWTPAVRRMHVASALNAAESWLKSLKDMEAEVLPVRAVPVAKSFGRRVRAEVA